MSIPVRNHARNLIRGLTPVFSKAHPSIGVWSSRPCKRIPACSSGCFHRPSFYSTWNTHRKLENVTGYPSGISEKNELVPVVVRSFDLYLPNATLVKNLGLFSASTEIIAPETPIIKFSRKVSI
eukprot:Sdes_comp20472_c0_seq1m14742